jgi:hypothetical protein
MGKSVAKAELAAIAVFFVIVAIVVVATGHPVYLIPIAILAVLIAGYALLNQRVSHRIVDDKHHGDVEEAMADGEDNVPAAHLIGDDERPLGDTPEAHDEISPHDIPMGAPERLAAEAQAGGEDGTSGGNREGGAGGGAATGTSDDTEQRTGDTQRSATEAK